MHSSDIRPRRAGRSSSASRKCWCGRWGTRRV